MKAALEADTAFLASLGVMDYSLLLGVDRQNRQLVVGIIDFVRQVGGGPSFAKCPFSRHIDRLPAQFRRLLGRLSGYFAKHWP